MDNEFEFEDDGFELLLSQHPINELLITKDDENKFKKPAEPKYSFNKLQEKLSQNNPISQQNKSNNVQNTSFNKSNQQQNQQQNKSNQQLNQQQNKSNQQLNQQQNKSNQQLNQQQNKSNQQNVTYSRSNVPNKPLSNQTAFNDNVFVKPQVPAPQKSFNNQSKSINSNLDKSIMAQTSKESKYSFYKQNLAILNNNSNQPNQSKINRPIQLNQSKINNPIQSNQTKINKPIQSNQTKINKPIQPTQSKINKSISSATSSLSSNNQTNSTITDYSVILSTQSASTQSASTQSASSQSTIQSQFCVSDNVPAKLTFDPSIKTVDYGIDPKDKYIGRIQMLEKSINKLKQDCEIANKNCKEKEKLIEELKEINKRNDEEIKAIKAFNEQEKTSREFKETVLNTTIDRISPIKNRGKSATTLQFKKQSPKILNRSLNQFSQNLSLQNDTTSLQINDLEFDMDDNVSDDSSIVGPTQIDKNLPQIKSNKLNSSNSTNLNDEIVNIKNENKQPTENDDDDAVIIPETQYSQTQQSETVKEELEMEIEINDIVEPISSIESNDEINNKTNIKRIKTKSESEDINDEIMNQLDDDDAIFHQPNFKFTDFKIYDYLEERGEINLFKDNLNPYYDQILDRINILEKINKEERLKELENLNNENKKEELDKLNELKLFNLIKDYEFDKFTKLNDELILKFLFNFNLDTIIPEYTFNLLTNLYKYNDCLENKNIINKLTNQCFILNSSDNKQINRFQNGYTFLNKILYFLSSFNEIQDIQSKNYQRLCYSIIQFLVQNTVEFNNIKEFHQFQLDKEEKDRCLCWKELYNVLGEFALYILKQFDIKNKLHYLIVKDLTKFIINLNRTNFQKDNPLGNARFSYFAQKLSLKLKCCYLDFLLS